MVVFCVPSTNGLWTIVSKPRIWHDGCRHLGFMKPEVTLFGRDGAAGDDRHCQASI